MPEQELKSFGKSPCPRVCVGRLVWCLDKSELSPEYAQTAAVSDSGQKPGISSEQLMHPTMAKQNPAALFFPVRDAVCIQKNPDKPYRPFINHLC